MSYHMMLDHPGWLVDEAGYARRAMRSGDSIWSLVCRTAPGELEIVRLKGNGEPPVVDTFEAVIGRPVALVRPLIAAGPVVRLRNADLWDALATSIIRQVIQAKHARKLYQKLCSQCGEKVETRVGFIPLFPSPESILAMSNQTFSELGLAFKQEPLRAAARAYLQSASAWKELSSAELLSALQTVHRVGPWSAAATVADVTNDFALYPFSDLAVRKWAKNIAPQLNWPSSESEFAIRWRRLAGEQLSKYTVLTLAWGVRQANGFAV